MLRCAERNRKSSILALSLALSLLSCILEDDKQANHGTVVGNEVRQGANYLADGNPAVGALDCFNYVDHVPDLANATYATVTDSYDQYTVDSLSCGDYNILGEKDGEYSYQDSVFISDRAVGLPADTLEAPGSVAGIVGLQLNDNPLSVTL